MNLGFDAPGAQPPGVLPAGFVAPANTGYLRMATAAYHSARTDAPISATWAPRILDDVEISQSALDVLGIGGRLALTVADVAVWNGDRALDDLWRYGTATGRDAWLRCIPVVDGRASDYGTPLAGRGLGAVWDHGRGTYRLTRTEPVLAFQGACRIVSSESDSYRLRISLTDLTERLDARLQPNRYAGTGGLEGPAELTDAAKPIAIGAVYNLAPIYLGDLDLGAGALPTYQSHWRRIQAHTAVRIRGVLQGAAGGTPSVGQFRDWPSLGVFQLGSTPDGTVTCDVEGDDSGGYVSTHTGVLRRLIQSLVGLGTAQWDGDASAWVDYTVPGDCGLHVGAQDVTAADAVQALLASAGLVLCGGRDGRLRLVDPIASGDEQFRLDESTIVALRPVEMPATLAPAPNVQEVEYRRNFAPLSDIAGSVTGTARTQLSQAAQVTRVISSTISSRVGTQRALRWPGLWRAQADAFARGAAWRSWLQRGPRAFEVTTDRYLGVLETGHIGRLSYPLHGLAGGVLGTVAPWREALGGRRLTITFVTLE